MNKERRNTIDKLAMRAAELHLQLEALKEEFETVRDEEQDYFDNMPESFQSGEKGERAQAAIDALDEACSALDTAKDELVNVEDFCSTASE